MAVGQRQPAWQLSGRQDTHASRCTHVSRRLSHPAAVWLRVGCALAARREAKQLPPHGLPRRAQRGQHVLAVLVAGAHQQRHARYSGGTARDFLPSSRPPHNLSLASFHAPRPQPPRRHWGHVQNVGRKNETDL